jgi:hypothetical protein
MRFLSPSEVAHHLWNGPGSIAKQTLKVGALLGPQSQSHHEVPHPSPPRPCLRAQASASYLTSEKDVVAKLQSLLQEATRGSETSGSGEDEESAPGRSVYTHT